MRINLNDNSTSLSAAKYKKGDFGYWWTVTKGKKDIEGKTHRGNIKCNKVGLTSLKGSPKTVTKDFNVSDNSIKSFEFSPEKIGGNLHFENNKLANLKFMPKNIGKGVYLSFNPLKSLKGCNPTINGYFFVRGCPITSLKGGPKIVKGSLNVGQTKIKNFVGGPEEIGEDIAVENTPSLKSFTGSPERIGGIVWVEKPKWNVFKDVPFDSEWDGEEDLDGRGHDKESLTWNGFEDDEEVDESDYYDRY